MTATLEENFGVKMVSHRAGRWSMDSRYARLLVEHGYTVDCSVTPHVSWRHSKGDPSQRGGTDFSHFPSTPYFVDLDDLGRPGDSPLLELPMSIAPIGIGLLRGVGAALPRQSPAGRVWHRVFPPVSWLRPNGRNLRPMQRLLRRFVREGRSYAEFMLHSSEFMPGGSPTFRTPESIEALYRDLEALFATAAESFTGMTLQEFARGWRPGEGRVARGG
jgi:hypothetical protein